MTGVAHLVRRLTIWIASLTVALLMMAIVLASAAHAQDAAGSWHGAIHLPTGNHRLAVGLMVEGVVRHTRR